MAHNHGSTQTRFETPATPSDVYNPGVWIPPQPQPFPYNMGIKEEKRDYSTIHRILNIVLIVGGVFLILKIIKVI